MNTYLTRKQVNTKNMVDHPVKNFLNFCHPSEEGKCLRLQLGY